MKKSDKNTKNKSKSKSKKSQKHSIEVRNIKLTKESRKQLKKIKDPLWGNVADAIECGDWWIPVKNYKFTHIKDELEKGMHDFFNIKKDTVIEIDCFDTDIIEFDNH